MSRTPTPRQAVRLLEKAGCAPSVIRHCKAVSRLAVKIAKKFQRKKMPVDVELVRLGGLLHDIGRSKTHGVDHAFVGSKIASAFGLSESVVKIVERHIGAGIPAEEAVELGLSNRDFVPETLEEKIVSYADKLIDGNRQMSFEEAFQKFAEDLGAYHPAIGRLRVLHAELSRMVGYLT